MKRFILIRLLSLTLAVAVLSICNPFVGPATAEVQIINAVPWLKISDSPRMMLEGISFDRAGNLYLCSVGTGEILKVTKDKKISTFFKDERVKHAASLDIHKDGRFFMCTYVGGKIVAISPDGKDVTEILTKVNGKAVVPDDLIFDSKGNFYFTHIADPKADPPGGIYRVSSDFKSVKRIYDVAYPNGISLSGGLVGPERRLYVSECLDNRVVRIDLTPDGMASLPGPERYGVVHHVNGLGSDSNAVDAAGNLYQCVLGNGIWILDRFTHDLAAKVVFEGIQKGETVVVTTVAIKPGTNQAFAWAGLGPRGSVIYTFKALADAPKLFSHQ